MEVNVRRVTADDWREMKRIRLAALATDRVAFGSTLEAEVAFGDEIWIDREGHVCVDSASPELVSVLARMAGELRLKAP